MIREEKKIIKCPSCHKKIKPIVEENKLKRNFYGQRFTGTEKKYLLICPNCKAVISSK
jgi:Zn finger protein HypA/HybF involved in hydrogenase expression